MYRRGDFGQVSRALRVLDRLRGYKHGRWVSEIATEIDSSERTVRRDIAELQEAGIDIEVTKRANRVFAYLTEERNYTPVAITKRERWTLMAARRVFDVFASTPFLVDFLSVLHKLEQRLSGKARTELAALGDQFVYMPDHGTKSYAGKEDVIDAIQTGITARKLVRYKYADARGRARSGYLAPFRMAMYRHGLYAIGARLKEPDGDASTAPLGVFAIERFTEAEHMRAHTFEFPTDSRVLDILQGSFGPHLPDATGPHDVVVEFSAERAHLVSTRMWHPTQEMDQLPDGRLRLKFRAPSIAPIVSWVLEWGPHAHAISPAELVEVVAEEVRRTHEIYARSVSVSAGSATL